MPEKQDRKFGLINRKQPVKVVAAMPELDPTLEEIKDMKAHDGYPESCGIPNPVKEE